MNRSATIGIVLLAAGSSSRLGQPKQLVQFQGKPLLQHLLDEIAPLPFANKVVVLGAQASKIRDAIAPSGFQLVINDQWTEGMSSSIRKGIHESIKRNPELQHVAIMLSDQPMVTASLMEELVEKHLSGNHSLTASFYGGDFGVPAIFSKKLFPDLLNLTGDQGAKRLMKMHTNELASISFEGGIFDIDTPEDYQKLQQLKIASI